MTIPVPGRRPKGAYAARAGWANVHTFAFALGSAGGQRSDVFIREHVMRATLDLELVVRLHRRSPVPPPFARDAARPSARRGML